MKVSVFTPTHNPSWLLEAYVSLIGQKYPYWEWVIQPNGTDIGRHIEIPADIRHDDRVKILPYTRADGIGCLKKMCCMQATGDLFVELDHDDWLTPTALGEIVRFAKDGAGFVYSDSVHYFEDYTNEVFGEAWGWDHYKFDYEGHTHTVMRSFLPCPRSLCEIYWSPNHVRAWTRKAYEKVGGHSGQLRVGDDHDLICRTYLAGIRFQHIPEPLYFYRRFKESETNSFVVENKLLQEQQYRNRDLYLHELIFEWCKRKGHLMLDLGGAHNCPKHKGFTAVDLHDAEIICDVTKGIPVEDNSVGCIRAQDFLEHIPIPEVPKLMNHLYEKLVPGGWLITGTPSVSDNEGRVGRGAWQDPTHVSYWSENNFWYYTDQTYAKYVTDIKCRFQAVRLNTSYPGDWHRKYQIPYVYADLYALKGQRAPGRQLI